MPNSQPNRNTYHYRKSHCKGDWFELPISETIRLIHAVGVDEGKTKNMAKGLFLCSKGKICAGESAGIGLPVWKTDRQTVFPSLSITQTIGETAIMKIFCMNRVLMWHVAGKKAPVWLNRIMEYLVNQYMKKAALQHTLLMFRDMIFNCFNIHSTMIQGADLGYCRVIYETTRQGLIVKVDGSGLLGRGELIMLNEFDGRSFDLLRTGDFICQGAEIPAWQAVPFDATLESSFLDIAVSVSFTTPEDRACCTVFCGREVALELDWAGLAIASPRKILTYQVAILPSFEKTLKHE